MTIKSSEQYLAKAAELAGRAERQTHDRHAMVALTNLGILNLELAKVLAEREAAGLTVPTEAEREPVAVLDCHDRRWVSEPGDAGWWTCVTPGIKPFGSFKGLEAAFGPLRPAEVSR